MKKYIFILLIFLFIPIYIGGYLNPTKIIINNLEIDAPKDMIIYSLDLDNEKKYYIMGLPFLQKNSYILNLNQKIRFTMINKGFFRRESKSISFELSNISLKRFYNRLKYVDKKEKLKKIDLYNKKCQIYSMKNKSAFIYRIYHMDNNLSISIYSNIQIDNISKALCFSNDKS